MSQKIFIFSKYSENLARNKNALVKVPKQQAKRTP